MSESAEPRHGGEIEPVRLPDADLESIEASVRKLLDQSAEQARMIDTLASAPPADPMAASMPFAGFPGMPSFTAPTPPPDPKPILELEGEEYEDEIAALTDWVDDHLMDVYGAEITTAAPWCEQWQEHLDVVAWLHALWMAYHQHKDAEAGPSGMFVWHRDFLTHCMAYVRAPGGPLSACQTDPDRAEHRLLRGPGPSTRSAARESEAQTTGGAPASDGAGL
ncbi:MULTISPECIES: DUF4913 domain-containing protein [unclassified Streptomyces]|uniref:DUF4913 domain-containing protein n=1 Tax=unclassified Streptomyces TaxID=2593676 RepID=UPI00225634A9|nr:MULTISPECIES: DUF4913 domain-containing protein [unclassified Streptomyces]MCX5308963.1 DUF4913 domain-containing protein [Streptomyces sp. NBC_00160]WSQ01922.1 DUF4913 domain-containing protein [Streptomyces sp. NBC_01232]WSR13409.1 DUF4913 domain-containing protein [Streptomyces sp. NBC_01207]